MRRLRILAEDHGYLGSAPRQLLAYPEVLFVAPGDGASPPRSSEADALLHGRREWIVDRLQAGGHPVTVFEELGLAVGRSSF